MQTLKHHFPALEWEELIAWGTGNGAQALGWQHELGFLRIGSRPGLICIKNRNDNPFFEVVVSACKKSG
jgi:imidazolonepropionase-like amidohydrolase